MKIFHIISKLIKNGYINGPHFKRNDFVRLKKSAYKHKNLYNTLGSKIHCISRVIWTKNLSYCDQFIYLSSGQGYYNTIFEKA